MFITIIIGLIVLSALVITHELGHFVTAKASGVRVEEFGIGFPPRLLSFQRGETRYSLNAVPFGGFNKLAGEEDPSVPRSLAGKSRGTRLLVLSAGSLMNLLLALILFSVSYLFPRPAATGQVVVEQVIPGSPAAVAGIERGDIILSVNDQPLVSSLELQQYIMNNLGKETALVIQHPNSIKTSIKLTPRLNPPKGEGAVGIAMSTVRRYPVWQILPLGAAEMVTTVIMWVGGLAAMFSGEAAGSLLGPVGIVQLTGEVAETGIVSLLSLAAMISLILGIMNLLPLPAIDGGRITFLFLEWVRRGKRISPRVEGIVHLVGLVLFLLLFLAITYQDILRLIRGETFLP